MTVRPNPAPTSQPQPSPATYSPTLYSQVTPEAAHLEPLMLELVDSTQKGKGPHPKIDIRPASPIDASAQDAANQAIFKANALIHDAKTGFLQDGEGLQSYHQEGSYQVANNRFKTTRTNSIGPSSGDLRPDTNGQYHSHPAGHPVHASGADIEAHFAENNNLYNPHYDVEYSHVMDGRKLDFFAYNSTPSGPDNSFRHFPSRNGYQEFFKQNPPIMTHSVNDRSEAYAQLIPGMPPHTPPPQPWPSSPPDSPSLPSAPTGSTTGL